MRTPATVADTTTIPGADGPSVYGWDWTQTTHAAGTDPDDQLATVRDLTRQTNTTRLERAVAALVQAGMA